ncbi:hypothetical protein A0J47_016385 [Photobacterium damselae subsp. damselae]|uniref:hypothetical protein n=1 Tax=Photobacterium damselae TaxID=38293 RepID=UPI00083B7AF4|nr:hypothetical protein [Photobacterium damselae]QSH59303.1 hypothetical protein A0J47_016385 [Photobacterium damselae subsp. damselae]
MEAIKTLIKNGLFLASLLGVYYLIVYTIREKIPFPLDLSVLPTLLMALGTLSLLFTIIIVLYSSISIIVISDPMNINYHDVFYARPTYIKNKNIASIFNFFIFFCFTPIIYFLVYYFEYPNQIWILSLLIIPVLFSYYAMNPNISIMNDKLSTFKNLRFWRTSITFIYISFFSMLSIFIFLRYISLVLEVRTDLEVILSLLVFAFLSYLILIPSRNKNHFEENAKKYEKRRIMPILMSSPAFIVYLAAGVFALIPQVSSKTASISFKFLNIGGGIERKYYFTPKSKIIVPSEIIEYCDNNDYCETKKLNIILDLGGYLYVKGDYFGYEHTIISLPRSKMNPIFLGTKKIKPCNIKEK